MIACGQGRRELQAPVAPLLTASGLVSGSSADSQNLSSFVRAWPSCGYSLGGWRASAYKEGERKGGEAVGMKRICLLAILLVFLTCKSSSPVMGTPTADIAGEYFTIAVTNGNTVRLMNCTGDLAFAEGRTYGGLPVDSVCVIPPLSIQQNGNMWNSHNLFTGCPPNSFGWSGSGTVSGDRIDGAFSRFDGTTNTVLTLTITNGSAVSGGTLIFKMPRVSKSGAETGSCSIVPPLEEIWMP